MVDCTERELIVRSYCFRQSWYESWWTEDAERVEVGRLFWRRRDWGEVSAYQCAAVSKYAPVRRFRLTVVVQYPFYRVGHAVESLLFV